MNSPVQAKLSFLPAVSIRKIGQRDLRAGFSLIELMAAIALIVVLAAMGAPSMLNPRSGVAVMDRSVSNLSLLLEQARTYAMANNTYVWVGFSTDTVKNTVTVAAMAGVSGASSDINAAASLRAISKPQVFENVELCSINATALSRETAVDLIGATGSGTTFRRNAANGTVSFGNLIQFGPAGDVRIPGGSVSRWLELGLQPLHGTKADTANIAAVQVGGLTGQVRVYRP